MCEPPSATKPARKRRLSSAKSRRVPDDRREATGSVTELLRDGLLALRFAEQAKAKYGGHDHADPADLVCNRMAPDDHLEMRRQTISVQQRHQCENDGGNQSERLHRPLPSDGFDGLAYHEA